LTRLDGGASNVAMKRTMAALLVAALVSAAACESAEPRPLVLPDSRGVFADTLAEIVCDRAEACCRPTGRDAPSEACITQMRNEAYVVMLVADDEKIDILYDQCAACLDRYRAAAGCDATLLAETLPTMCPEMFGAIPSGANAPGAACEHGYECAAPDEGEQACMPSSTSGVCTWFVPAASGEACATDPVVVRVCPEGEGCRPSTVGAMPACEPLGAWGDPCLMPDSCGAGLTCSANANGSRQCVDTLGVGQLCDERPDACEPTAYCEPGTTKCKLLPVVAACAVPACPDYALEKVCR
jgi:hypothetical protein